jgi:hypothetical protein
MKTDDIKCENSKGGYNSSIILWRRDFGREIFDFMLKYETTINNQIIRFDHFLEFLVRRADFIQDEFEEKVLDYNFYCKDKDYLPEGGSIIAFPRTPKPHDCNEKWIEEHWR